MATSILVLPTDNCIELEATEGDSFKDQECKVEEIILAFFTTSGLKGWIPDFLSPDLILGMAKVCSFGLLNNQETSLLETLGPSL